MSFEGQVVLVTGGASGIGAAIATGFARAGARVEIADRNAEAAQAHAAALGAESLAASAVALDVTDEAAVEAAIADVVARHGGLDHAVACAGVSSRHTIFQMPAATWRRVLEVNLTGAFLVVKFAAGPIAERGGGSITTISSIAADHIAYGSGVHYAASKSAHFGLVRHAAFELGRKGVRVNTIGPGPMANRMGGGLHDADRQAALARDVPLQRVVDPADVADAAMFLASPQARAITGVFLPVDCGFLTGRGHRLHTYFDQHGEAF